MDQFVREVRHKELLKALALLSEALEILDAADAPADIGAHVDLALCRVRETLGTAFRE